MALRHAATSGTQPEQGSGRWVVRIGLVNNMSDEALKGTERQFRNLVGASAKDCIDAEFRLFTLGQTPRSPRAREYINGNYEPAVAVLDGNLDALIITGAQPRTKSLSDEIYWDELTELIDWAKEHTVSTIFSCLAAHAAVLHLDDVERQLLPEKCTGVFPFELQGRHRFAGWREQAGSVPHSRYNGLSQSDLERAGYEVLMSSPAHGVDSFTKNFGSEFIFLQGHPEYDANSLAREYRRDLGRYLRRETDRRPPRPRGYFSAEAERKLDALELRVRDVPSRLANEDLLEVDALAPATAQWRDAAMSFYRNWIRMIADSRLGRAAPAPSPVRYVGTARGERQRTSESMATNLA